VDIEVGVERVFIKTVDEVLTLFIAILVKFEFRLVEARDDIGTGNTVIVVASDVVLVVEVPRIDPETVGITVTDATLAGIGSTVILVASDVEFVVKALAMDPELVGIVVTDAILAGIGSTVIVCTGNSALSVELTVADVLSLGKLEIVVSGSAVCKSEVVEFAADTPMMIVPVIFARVVADSVTILAVACVVVLANDVTGAVMTATGEGVTKVNVSIDDELVEDPMLATSVTDGSTADMIGVASRLTVTLTPIETSCLLRSSFDSTRGT